MRLFRYLDTPAALATIEHRALRVSRLVALNDPFEWRIGVVGLIPGVEHLEQAAVKGVIEELNKTVGLICLSEVSTEPVLWAHYADRHRGIALELECPGDRNTTIQMAYTDERPHVDASCVRDIDHLRGCSEQLYRQKSLGWAYEREYRLYKHLPACDIRGGSYFVPMTNEMLCRVILGWRCSTDAEYVKRALNLAGYDGVEVVQAQAQRTSYGLLC